MTMIRLHGDQVLDYIPLQTGDPMFIRRAIAFTLTPDPEDPKWDIVTYYTNDSVNLSPLSPLEIMYKEWYGIDSTKDTGD